VGDGPPRIAVAVDRQASPVRELEQQEAVGAVLGNETAAPARREHDRRADLDQTGARRVEEREIDVEGLGEGDDDPLEVGDRRVRGREDGFREGLELAEPGFRIAVPVEGPDEQADAQHQQDEDEDQREPELEIETTHQSPDSPSWLRAKT